MAILRELCSCGWKEKESGRENEAKEEGLGRVGLQASSMMMRASNGWPFSDAAMIDAAFAAAALHG
eukprot:352598-Chlamydomonas_euryale.AAC.3